MLKRLSLKSLIIYKPYKSINLSEKGKNIGINLLRKHRLWKTFLVNYLDFNWEEINEIADELEHVKSEKLIKKIDEILENPKFDPYGEAIPSSRGMTLHNTLIKLSDLKPSNKGIISGITDKSKNMINQLTNMKLFPNKELKVIDLDLFSRDIKIQSKGEIMFIPYSIAEKILISKTNKIFNKWF